jgi:hypothetical protein
LLEFSWFSLSHLVFESSHDASKTFELGPTIKNLNSLNRFRGYRQTSMPFRDFRSPSTRAAFARSLFRIIHLIRFSKNSTHKSDECLYDWLARRPNRSSSSSPTSYFLPRKLLKASATAKTTFTSYDVLFCVGYARKRKREVVNTASSY